jgi:hypothetical protein
MTRYNFVKDVESQQSKEYEQITFYYQVAFFKILIGGVHKHHLRKFVINPDNSILGYYNYYLTDVQMKKFIGMKKPNEYRCFNVDDLALVDYPSGADILVRKSELFN